MSGSVEIARFRVAPGSAEGLLAAWPPMVDAMKRAHPALESVRLVRFDDGTWADVAVWADRESAEQACSLAPPPEVEAFFRHISEDVSMDVTTLVREG
jgi:alpha/beta superfamily hydrolase